MGASLLFPLFSRNTITDTTTTEPTAVPSPTVPAPPADLTSITFENKYLHPSGLFTVAQPTGWTPQTPSNNGVQAQINFRNADLLSVIEAYTEIPAASLTTLDELNAHFNQAVLEAGWRSYTEWRETGRRLDTAKNQVLIDFELTQGRQSYLARHVAWTDGTWIYVVRVVTTPNMRDLLLYLLEQLPPTLQPNPLFVGSPAAWTSFYNPSGSEIIRFPSSWTIADGRAGFPTSVQGLNGESLRVEVPTAGVTVADEAAARDYVQNLRPGVTPNTVSPVTRNGGTGFAVSYNSTSLDGEGESGLAVLLNGDDGALHVATIRIKAAGVDLNNLPEGATVDQQDAVGIMNSFNLTTGLNLPVPTATPTSTPSPIPPTLAPTEPVVTEEVGTAEVAATDEAVVTDDAAATEEVATEDPAATAEVTAAP